MRLMRTMTATGRAVRCITLIGLFAWMIKYQPRRPKTSESGLPSSGMGSPRPGMRRLGY